MCLAIPMKIVSINDNIATTEVNNVNYEVNITMLPQVGIGDYVIVHAGFAIEKLDEKEALKTLNIWQDIDKFNKKIKS